jgi:hypothetical protein
MVATLALTSVQCTPPDPLPPHPCRSTSNRHRAGASPKLQRAARACSSDLKHLPAGFKPQPIQQVNRKRIKQSTPAEHLSEAVVTRLRRHGLLNGQSCRSPSPLVSSSEPHTLRDYHGCSCMGSSPMTSPDQQCTNGKRRTKRTKTPTTFLSRYDT